MRLVIPVSKSVIDNIIFFARTLIGTEYSGSEAKLSLLGTQMNAKEGNRQFCTRFIAQVYSHVGINLVANPDYCSPKHLQESKFLSVITNMVYKASQSQINYANEKDTVLDKQTEIHNTILEKARNLSKTDIQTLEQLIQYVVENPKSEDEIIKIIEESDYLMLWKHDVDKNPWSYDYNKFLKHYENPYQRKALGSLSVRDEPEIRKRYLISYSTMKQGYDITKLKICEIFLNLYSKLIELSKQRESVGAKALEE